jgi:transposase, IS5 family
MKLLKRRQAIEPIIGHLKADHHRNRCHLKGEIGDRIRAVLRAAGYNIRWFVRMIVKKGLRAFLRLLRIASLLHVLRSLLLGGNTDVDGRLASRQHSMALA